MLHDTSSIYWLRRPVTGWKDPTQLDAFPSSDHCNDRCLNHSSSYPNLHWFLVQIVCWRVNHVSILSASFTFIPANHLALTRAVVLPSYNTDLIIGDGEPYLKPARPGQAYASLRPGCDCNQRDVLISTIPMATNTGDRHLCCTLATISTSIAEEATAFLSRPSKYSKQFFGRNCILDYIIGTHKRRQYNIPAQAGSFQRHPVHYNDRDRLARDRISH